MKKSWSLLVGCLLMAACSDRGEPYRISAPDTVAPGQLIPVAVSGRFGAGATITWTATAGHIEGNANGIAATFVAPDAGAARLLCNIAMPGKPTVAVDKQITIVSGAAVVHPPDSPVSPPSGPPPGRSLDIESFGFIPSGWMGDYTGLKADINSLDNPHSPPKCQRWSYRPPSSGGEGWAAVAWQFPEKNWGDLPGKNWNASGFHTVSAWARGVADHGGNYPRIQFKAGGATAPGKRYQASFEVAGDIVTLTKDWKEYTLDVTGQDLRQVVSAFLFVVKASDVGPDGATFYLDDIQYK